MYGGESDVAFRTGDFVRNDYVAYFDGCPGHQSRLAILGPPSAEQMRGYELTLEIHRKTIDRCQAGVTAGEIYAFAVAEFRKKGIDYTASLVGHGMGPWFHQQEPVLRRGSAIVLEKGMILAVEPQRLHWHLQDLVLIGGGAPELVSDKFAIDQPVGIWLRTVSTVCGARLRPQSKIQFQYKRLLGTDPVGDTGKRFALIIECSCARTSRISPRSRRH